MMDEETRIKIAQEIYKAQTSGKLQPDEITHRIYAEANGITVKVAERQLQKEVQEGRMTARMCLHKGKHTWAYRVSQGATQ